MAYVEDVEFLLKKLNKKGRKVHSRKMVDELKKELAWYKNEEKLWEKAEKEYLEELAASRKRGDELVADADLYIRWVLSHYDADTHQDFACSQCVPNGKILIKGFLCAPHLAKHQKSQGTIKVNLKYMGQSKSLPVDNPLADSRKEVNELAEALDLIETIGNDAEKMQGIASVAIAKHQKSRDEKN